jgi:hypothetical protein
VGESRRLAYIKTTCWNNATCLYYDSHIDVVMTWLHDMIRCHFRPSTSRLGSGNNVMLILPLGYTVEGYKLFHLVIQSLNTQAGCTA